MHVYMTALKPCRFRPGHHGRMPLVLYDVLQAAPLYEREREREIYLGSAAEQTNYDDEQLTKTASARRSRACLPCA